MCTQYALQLFRQRTPVAVFAADALHRPPSPTLSPDELAQRINLNTATKKELMTLPGIGDKTADAILSAREEAGGFRYVEELLSIRGIGEKKLSAVYDLVYVQPLSTPLPPP